jgi:hypothetical protein
MTYILRPGLLLLAGLIFTYSISAILQVMTERETDVASAFEDPSSGSVSGFLVDRP